MEKKIMVISWDDAMSMIPTSNLNEDLCTLISDMCKDLKRSQKNYVYHIQLDFGEKFIDKGRRIQFEKDHILENKISNINKNKADFISDLEYSKDPLGMVLKNHIEIYSENELLKISNSKYRVHLNTIKSGGLFGLYGTLDFLNGNISDDEQDWYAMAGNSCFEILFPFLSNTDYGKIDNDRNENRHFLNKQIATNVDEKVAFFKKYINIIDNNWKTDIIYFPKHFLECENFKFRIELFKIGWAQSRVSRNFLFENKAISDVIDDVDTISALKNNKHLLNFLLDYIIKAAKGKAFVLKPLNNENHILHAALSKFKDDISFYIEKKSSCVPAILYYDTIVGKRDWGCFAIDRIPILLNYPKIILNDLEKDLNEIGKKYSLPKFYTTADKGSGTDRCIGRNTLENNIKVTLGLSEKEKKIHTKSLSNFIVINDFIAINDDDKTK